MPNCRGWTEECGKHDHNGEEEECGNLECWDPANIKEEEDEDKDIRFVG